MTSTPSRQGASRGTSQVFKQEGREIDLVQLADDFRRDIICKNRLFHLRVFKNCFVGKEAIDYLVITTHLAREEARALGTFLGNDENCPFEHVCDPKGHPTLEDGYIFYRFKSPPKKQKDIKQKKKELLQDVSATSVSDSSSTGNYSGSIYNATPEEQMRFFERGIKVQDRKFRLRTYPSCFIGSKAVDFMIKSGLVATREDAVKLGRRWVRENNLFEHVLRNHDFEDQHFFYRFVKKKQRFNSLNNDSNAFARTNYDVDIHLLDDDMSLSSDSRAKSSDGSSSVGPFHMSFISNSASSRTASKALDKSSETAEEFSMSHDTSVSGSASDSDYKRVHSLAEVAQAMELNVTVRRRRWRMAYYDNCFIAKDAVSYLVNAGFASSRQAAVKLGKRIQHDLNAYHHVCEEHDFGDGQFFFRFTPKGKRFEEPVMVELPIDQIAVQFECGVRVGTHAYRIRTYPKTFVGTQAVDFLVQSRLADSRMAAVRLGRALVEKYGLFVNVTGDVAFADDDQFLFRFVPEDERKEQKPSEDSTFPSQESIQTINFDSGEKVGPQPQKVGKLEFIFSAEELREHKLVQVAEVFRSGISVKNNRWRARIYPRTFIGSQAVTFLVNSSYAPSRKAAVELGRKLQRELKLFRSYTKSGDDLLKDDYVFYKFNEVGGEDDSSARSLTSELATSCNAESLLPLASIADLLQKGIRSQDRRYRLKIYKNCFIGSEAVDFLVGSNLADSRHGAVDLGRRLRREFNLFEHVVDPLKPFHDDHLFYRFDKQRKVNETQQLFENMEIKRLVASAICFEEGMPCHENRVGLRVYKNTFFGSDAVDFCLENFRFMINSRNAAVHFVRRLASEFMMVELTTADYGFKDCDKSLYFFTRPELRTQGMFFERLPRKQTLSRQKSVSKFWNSIANVVGDIPRVSEFEIETDDMEWSKRLKDFEMRCSAKEDFDNSFLLPTEAPSFDLTLSGKVAEWADTFRKLDPRYQILSFFNQVAQEGATTVCEETKQNNGGFINKRPLLWYLPNRASVFTVWRPTSSDAIRRMMCGEAVGKGLDIKGKSAKRGKLSGYVPFLQISNNKHKKDVKAISKESTVRIFYSKESRGARDLAVEKLEAVAVEMIETVKMAKKILESDKCNEEAFRDAYESMLLDMADPTIRILDNYAPERYGIEIPERLFWQAYVIRQDITRKPGCEYCPGRPSQPAFQDLNLTALRHEPVEGEPQTVIYQNADPESPMNPFELLMAYEEHDTVLPVCSDFDNFLMGTRRVDFNTPLPNDQVEVMRWMLSGIESVLKNREEGGDWTEQWIDILRKANKSGFHPDIPRFGFGDAKSYAIMEQATNSVRLSGAVRHGGESFNYYFPQELDEEFLVISDDLPGTKLQWKYMDVQGLLSFLETKIDEGFTFPLNPKWILADGGKWKKIFDKMLNSNHPNIVKSMESWFPVESGIREEIERICKACPTGFFGTQST